MSADDAVDTHDATVTAHALTSDEEPAPAPAKPRRSLKAWYRARWLRVAYPDWGQIPVDDRTQAEAAFAEVWFSRWYPCYLVILLTAAWMGGGSVFASGLALLLVLSWHGLALVLLALPFAVIAGVSFDVLTIYAARGALRRSVRRGLRRRGVEVCLDCGYFLSESPATQSSCSECGAERVPLEDGGFAARQCRSPASR